MTDEKTGAVTCRQLISDRKARALMDGLSDTFFSRDDSFWHVHIDASLRSGGRGDATGFAMGRISHTEVERDPRVNAQGYERVVRTFDVPLACRIVSLPGEQISLSGLVEFVLRLRSERGFNITSVSMDQYQSSLMLQEFAEAGIAVPGVQINDETGEATGIPRPFSVDGRATQPYRDLREAVDDLRIRLPRYLWMRKEMLELEDLGAGYAPDHPVGDHDETSKDVLDACAGVVGYLSAYGHAALVRATPERVVHGADLGLDEAPDGPFGVDDDDDGVHFGVE